MYCCFHCWWQMNLHVLVRQVLPRSLYPDVSVVCTGTVLLLLLSGWLSVWTWRAHLLNGSRHTFWRISPWFFSFVVSWSNKCTSSSFTFTVSANLHILRVEDSRLRNRTSTVNDYFLIVFRAMQLLSKIREDVVLAQIVRELHIVVVQLYLDSLHRSPGAEKRIIISLPWTRCMVLDPVPHPSLSAREHSSDPILDYSCMTHPNPAKVIDLRSDFLLPNLLALVFASTSSLSILSWFSSKCLGFGNETKWLQENMEKRRRCFQSPRVQFLLVNKSVSPHLDWGPNWLDHTTSPPQLSGSLTFCFFQDRFW